ncbi:MAG: hypothetical protein A2X13_04435 [Bacteroidetes bacterium GWC2_33_15]|nr:MAG: hypothetical protein A2X10_06280 [Bacteroidetes bacterium GWA2_33_15]OFX49779.1 MAG: hypothetical protein A2X13_04435 [Bacteroidetes bacterium GWC2_33_15]OFX64970.1 MAG: hypothetical protein A2X15_06355 [Bacteroidetes bacterium GWB2_32_14]OFX69068.1 MAG: hypothetical protein A2X14_13800 [Bacteroidetes bacterium GWD2_33_33]HAN18338.1 hypothetical protein [Bacteroidales bacterium]
MKNRINPEVCLVCMPFSSIVRPSIALGLLQGHLDKANISCKTKYANIQFAENIGLKYYTMIGSLAPSDFFLADWMFNKFIFSSEVSDTEDYITRIYESFIIQAYPTMNYNECKNLLLGLKEKSSRFIEDLAIQIIEEKYRIIGSTSSFHQHLASISLFKKIKELDQSITTILGGANCEGKMGLTTHKSYPWVDYVVSGEADEFFTSLISNILNGLEYKNLENSSAVLTPEIRLNNYQEIEAENMFVVSKNLDDLPYSNFDDYFIDLKKSNLSEIVKPALLLESSRGCWWGQKHKCTFCGLNHPKAHYRKKSPDRLLAELDFLEKKYSVSMFEMTDNILSMEYFKEVIPRLNNKEKSRYFFYETKSNLNESHIREMKDAGITWVQPGIESLNTKILKLMNKGVMAWQNIKTLKLARSYGIRLSWNFLWGFPKEDDKWYEEVSEWLPLIEHLQPPSSFLQIRIHRHSTYFNNKEDYNLNLKYLPAFKYVFGLDEVSLIDASYTFKPEGWADPVWDFNDNQYKERPSTSKVGKLIIDWQRSFMKFQLPVLSISEKNEKIEVLDTRKCSYEIQYKIQDLEKDVYISCERMDFKKNIYSEFINKGIDLLEIDLIVETLKKKKLILEIDDRLIALGLRGEIPHLPSRNDFPGGGINQSVIELKNNKTIWEIEETKNEYLSKITSTKLCPTRAHK